MHSVIADDATLQAMWSTFKAGAAEMVNIVNLQPTLFYNQSRRVLPRLRRQMESAIRGESTTTERAGQLPQRPSRGSEGE